MKMNTVKSMKETEKPNECIGCCGEQYWDDGFPRILYTRCGECINYTKNEEHHSYYYYKPYC